MTVPSPLSLPPNICVETLDTFARHFKEWAIWSAPFFVVMGILSAFMVEDMTKLVAVIEANKGSHDHKASLAILGMMGPMAKWVLLLMLFGFLQHYVYFVFFTQREVKIGEAKLSVGRFFLYIFYIFLFLLMLVGIELLALGAILLSILILPKALGVLASILTGITLFCVMLLMSVRLSPLSVFAVAKVEPVIGLSWQLTRGSFWRLFGNFLLLGILLIVIMSVLSIVMLGASLALAGSFPHMGENPIIGGLRSAVQTTLQGGLIASFTCTATRILIDEKRQSDPSFLPNPGR